MNIKPLSDRILVEYQSTEEIRESGIVILEDRKDKIIVIKAIVKEIGNGEEVQLLGLKIGAVVLVNKYASFTEIDPNNPNLRILLYTDILAEVV